MRVFIAWNFSSAGQVGQLVQSAAGDKYNVLQRSVPSYNVV